MQGVKMGNNFISLFFGNFNSQWNQFSVALSFKTESSTPSAYRDQNWFPQFLNLFIHQPPLMLEKFLALTSKRNNFDEFANACLPAKFYTV